MWGIWIFCFKFWKKSRNSGTPKHIAYAGKIICILRRKYGIPCCRVGDGNLRIFSLWLVYPLRVLFMHCSRPPRQICNRLRMIHHWAAQAATDGSAFNNLLWCPFYIICGLKSLHFRFTNFFLVYRNIYFLKYPLICLKILRFAEVLKKKMPSRIGRGKRDSWWCVYGRDRDYMPLFLTQRVWVLSLWCNKKNFSSGIRSSEFEVL